MGISEQKKLVFDEKWNRFYMFAKEYYLKNGNLDVPKDYLTTDNHQLLTWIRNQKQAYNKGKLSEEKINLLLEIGVDFKAERIRMPWEKVYEQVVVYYKRYGNINIPKDYKENEGPILYSWLKSQKVQYQRGLLNEEQIKKLNDIGFIFDNLTEVRWEEQYKEAKGYVLQGEDLNKSNRLFSDNTSIKKWIDYQRRLFLQGKLSQDKINRLKELNINFNPKNNHINWEEAYEKAKTYKSEFGSIKIPRTYQTSDGYKLGAWLNAQKNLYKAGKLKEERIELLEELGVTLSNVDNDSNNIRVTWEEAFDMAKNYYNEYGNLQIQTNYIAENGYKLGVWIDHQRSKYKEGVLSEDKIKQLESIDMPFEQKTTQWLKMYKRLLQYYKENNSVNVPSDYITKDNYPLGKWVKKQKELYWSGKLRDNQRRKLEEINITGIIDNNLLDLNNINQFIIKICIKLGIDYQKNYDVLVNLSLDDFRYRLTYLKNSGLDYCDKDGYLHEIFNVNNNGAIDKQVSRLLIKNKK